MKGFYFVLLVFLLSACGYPDPWPRPFNRRPISLKVINYNLWHGLGGSGLFKREVLEPDLRKNQRLQHQIQLLNQAQPDILFIQEVNPVFSLSRDIAQVLGMNYVYQKTNCGISVLGLSLPVNLSMGIAILARPPLQINKIQGLKLSGPAGFCKQYLSFQYAEFRYALFAIAYHPQYGSFLLTNTHLHHGPEWSSQVREQLDAWQKEKVLTVDQKTELSTAIEKSNNRRKSELTKLFSKITDIQEYYQRLPLILAGDFNSTAESPIYKDIIETYRMKDSVGENYSLQPYTWNPEENKANHEYTAKFGVSVPTFDKLEIESFFKKYDRRQRRIDYVFVSSDIKVLSHDLFAHTANAQGIIGSDHFGVLVFLDVQ